MMAWWRSLSRRERAMLAVLGTLALIVVSWFALIDPLRNAQRAAAERHERAVAEEVAVDRGLAELAALRRATPARPRRKPVADAVAESAAVAGIDLSRSEPDPSGGLRVAIEGAAPGVVFPWLASLQRDDGVAASHLTVLKADGGGLTVDATLVGLGR